MVGQRYPGELSPGCPQCEPAHELTIAFPPLSISLPHFPTSAFWAQLPDKPSTLEFLSLGLPLETQIGTLGLHDKQEALI